MAAARHTPGLVLAALDEVRFGAANILNLRSSRPTLADALARTEAWLRERQVARAGEVLVITGRGNGSPDGISVVRDGVLRLSVQLRRRGVVASAREHSPGAVAVTLAPMSALVDAPARTRHVERKPAASPVTLEGLTVETRGALEALAIRSLADLGARVDNAPLVEGEMLRLFERLAASAASDAELARAVGAARDELDER